MAEKAWKGTTYGSAFMHRWLIRLLGVIGTRPVYAFAAVCVVPVCFFTTDGWRYVYRYLRQRHGFSRRKSLRSTYKNLCLFSQVVIDRFAMYGGKRFKVHIEGYDNFLQLARRKDGFLQLSAHIGNYELAGYTLPVEGKGFDALVYAGEKASVMSNREKMFADTNISMIAVRPDGSHVFEINEALLRGDIVSMPADRAFGSAKTIMVRLLGAEARLPLGPFAVASTRGLEVIAVSVVKVCHDTYYIYVEPLAYDRGLSQREQMQQLANAYASELERILCLYPEQWYNYFPFWKEE